MVQCRGRRRKRVGVRGDARPRRPAVPRRRLLVRPVHALFRGRLLPYPRLEFRDARRRGRRRLVRRGGRPVAGAPPDDDPDGRRALDRGRDSCAHLHAEFGRVDPRDGPSDVARGGVRVACRNRGHAAPVWPEARRRDPGGIARGIRRAVSDRVGARHSDRNRSRPRRCQAAFRAGASLRGRARRPERRPSLVRGDRILRGARRLASGDRRRAAASDRPDAGDPGVSVALLPDSPVAGGPSRAPAFGGALDGRLSDRRRRDGAAVRPGAGAAAADMAPGMSRGDSGGRLGRRPGRLGAVERRTSGVRRRPRGRLAAPGRATLGGAGDLRPARSAPLVSSAVRHPGPRIRGAPVGLRRRVRPGASEARRARRGRRPRSPPPPGGAPGRDGEPGRSPLRRAPPVLRRRRPGSDPRNGSARSTRRRASRSRSRASCRRSDRGPVPTTGSS